MAIRVNTAEGHSLGEAAGIPAAVADKFRARGIRVVDVPAGLALANLPRRARGLGAPGLAEAAAELARAIPPERSTPSRRPSPPIRSTAHHSGTAEVLVGPGAGADVIVSTTLDTAAVADAFQGLAPMGSLVLTGVTVEPLPIVPAVLVAQQQRVLGSLVGSREEMLELLQIASRHGIKPLTEVYPLAEVNTAHERLRRNEARYRPVLTSP